MTPRTVRDRSPARALAITTRPELAASSCKPRLFPRHNDYCTFDPYVHRIEWEARDQDAAAVVGNSKTLVAVTNWEVAEVLDEIARLLRLRGADPFRVAAYRRAGLTVRNWPQPLSEIFAREGVKGLLRLPGIGNSLAKKIAELLRRGKSRSLDRLRQKHSTTDLLTTLPSVGKRLADRIRSDLGVNSLEELFEAAEDGRLRRISGLGRKRVQAIRESLALRLGPRRPRRARHHGEFYQPSVGLLLDIDRMYREKALAGRLLAVAPRRFNPTGAAWLPILRGDWHGRQYCAHYSNTAQSHELGHARDWVVIRCEDKRAFGQWTVATATHGILRGQRIVKGREWECQEYYRDTRSQQLRLPIR